MASELVRTVASVTPHVEWGWLLAVEFFLNAVATGTFVAGSLPLLTDPTAARRLLPRLSAVLALLFIAIAPPLLLLDLGQPARFWHLYVLVNPTSPLSWGTFFLSLFPLIVALHGLLLGLGRQRASRLSAALGCALALLTQGYTAYVIHLGRGRVLWDSSLIPPLFLASAFAAGAGALLFVAPAVARLGRSRLSAEALGGLGPDLSRLGGQLAITLVLVLVLSLALVGELGAAGSAGQSTLAVLTTPPHGWLALGGVLGLGIVLPLALLASPWRRTSGARLLAGGSVLLGVLSLRLVLVVSAQVAAR